MKITTADDKQLRSLLMLLTQEQVSNLMQKHSNIITNRLDYQPLFWKMSPHSSPRGGSKTGPGRGRKSSQNYQRMTQNDPRYHKNLIAIRFY